MVAQLQVRRAHSQRRARSARQQRRAAAYARQRNDAGASLARGFVGSHGAIDLDLLRRRRRHVQLGAGDALDERVRRPGALLELQLAPLDFEVVALPVEPLELDEQLARAVLAVDRTGGRTQRREPTASAPGRHEQRLRTADHRQLLARRAAARCARADCARSPPRSARSLRPTSVSARLRRRGHHRQARAAPDRRCDCALHELLDRAVLERVEADRPPAGRPAPAPRRPPRARARAGPSSSLMNMRSAWKVRVAGCLPGSRVRTARATSSRELRACA